MWRFAAARATGTSHLKSGLPCQDRFRCLVLNGSTLVAAVADGAGSAAMADRGAELATERLTTSVAEAIAAGRSDFASMLREGAIEARETIIATAAREGATARDFAATLLAVIIDPNGGAALQIGDGVIVVTDGSEGWSWVFWPQHGEYANTTRFITDDDAAAYLRAEHFANGVRDVALMSDGLEPLALHFASRSAHDPFFNALFGPLYATDGTDEIVTLSAQLEAFLASPRVTNRADDDLSFVMATRRANGTPETCS